MKSFNQILFCVCITLTIYVVTRHREYDWKWIIGQASILPLILTAGTIALSAVEYSVVLSKNEEPFSKINPNLLLFLNLILYLIGMGRCLHKYSRKNPPSD